MQTIHRLEDVPRDRKSVVTVGTFDGVHRAHQEIIRQAVVRAKARQARSVIVTFDPHPKTVVGNKPDEAQVLTTLEEREELCRGLGIDLLLVIRFDAEFSRIPFADFTRRYLVDGLAAVEVLEGYDHHWGRNREGDVSALKHLGAEWGFAVDAIEPIRVNGVAVNSSTIRRLLLAGRVAEAAELLGRPYEVRGTVVRGDERGRTLGYPTANLDVSDRRKLIPANGIYAARVTAAQQAHPGLVSIGVRPTFHSDGARRVEAHLLDFSGDLYGRPIAVHFIERLRDELKFETSDALIAQMKQDEAQARALITKRPNDFS
jgi:riboflavin kinase/FMN adenylyltransferase